MKQTTKTFFDYTDKEKKAILSKAAKASNREQRKLVIEAAVHKAVADYGDALKKLGEVE